MMARKIKRIGPFTESVKAQFSTFAEAFAPGWDRSASYSQKWTDLMSAMQWERR
jgi:hypothetical protein